MGRKASKSIKKELFYNEDANEAPQYQESKEEIEEHEAINQEIAAKRLADESKELQEEINAGKMRINIWISAENVNFLRIKAKHTGSNVASLCSIAVSDYCDEQR